ncbi:hypothetical protein, partial [Vibrio sp. 10N.261.46.C10]|uniref:hypothetical protein n=1 Tax=Vibrio sp. 10N.261.46.C10 TaxID=3229660 RepID=UPI003550D7B2
FLPIDNENNYKIHIHGWFDLDDKRTALTLTKGNDDQQPLVDWNLLLAEYAIGKAWAMLLLHCKNKLSLSKYYELWPTGHNQEFDKRVSKGFYTKISTERSLYVCYRDQHYWAIPSKKQYYV